jgi:hypothetical protein
MTTRSGRIARVDVNGNKITGQGTWTLSGFTREIIEEDSWDVDIKKKYFSVGNAGTLTFSGLHDPDDATGQDLLDEACNDSSTWDEADGFRLYVDNTSYWGLHAGATILITKVQSITMEKSSMGTVDFEAHIEGGEMQFH